MSKPTKHHGFYDEHGKLHAESFIAACRVLRDKRAAVVFTVKEFRESRSIQANRYYWGVVVKLIGEGLSDAGWEPSQCTAEAVHDMLKFRFLREDRPIGKHGDEFITTVRSTSDMEVQEFGAYIEHCIQFAAEYLLVQIPEPGEQVALIK